jgi:uncharacterized protein
MFIEVGPASLVVTVRREGKEIDPDRSALKKRVWDMLEEIGAWLPILKQRASRILNVECIGRLPRRMVEAARAVDGEALTPMAAVAGAVSDTLKEYLAEGGFDFVSVNNGGDMAVHSAGGRTVRVGISDSEKRRPTPYVLTLHGLADFGIATSGLGGRSFTLGLADTVTVVANTGALADAAATYIGNMTNTEAAYVTRKRASEIDPATDIPDEWVTVTIGELSGEEIEKALASGLAAARDLEKRGLILGAVILLRDRMATTIKGEGNIALEVLDLIRGK